MIICVLDTETTGLNAGYHEVIQAAAILCDLNLEEISRVSFKLRPKFIERASEKALEINGYHPRTWKPDFFSAEKAFLHLNKMIIEACPTDTYVVMAGQNVMFDYNFLKADYAREGVPFIFSMDTLDLIKVSKLWSSLRNIPLQRHSLKYLAEFTNQVNTNPHDAEADAEVTLSILKWFINDLKKVSKHDKREFNKHSSIKI